MKNLEGIILGIASISCLPSSNLTDVIEKYPATYERNAKKAIVKSWAEVGKTMQGAIDKYDKETKKNG